MIKLLNRVAMGAVVLHACVLSTPLAFGDCDNPPPGCDVNWACVDIAVRADVSDNGFVGSEDLAQLLSRWTVPGSPPLEPCERLDFNNDGFIASQDLAQLLSVWGAVPEIEIPPVCPEL